MLVVGGLLGSGISALETEGVEWQFLLTVLEELEGLLVSSLPGLPLLKKSSTSVKKLVCQLWHCTDVCSRRRGSS